MIWAGNSLEASAPCAVLNLDKEVVLTKTQNICPLKEELEEMKQSSEKMNQKLEALLKTAEELPVMELKAADVETRVVEYRSNVECVPEEARKFVDTLSKEKLVALASGDPGKGQEATLALPEFPYRVLQVRQITVHWKTVFRESFLLMARQVFV